MSVNHPGRGVALVLAALLGMACANRGMHAPTDGSATGVAGTSAGGRGGGAGGIGGAGATGGTCPTPPAHDGGSACTAKFNFENNVQGAAIAATGQAAFTAVATSDEHTFCGAGALAITASFSGTSGTTTKGVVEIPVAGSDRDFTGKTLTVHFMADPGCSSDLGIAVALQTDSGDKIVLPTFRPVTSTWKTETVTFEAGDGGIVGQDTVRGISVQAFSSSGYAGTIYVDEIAVTGP